MTDLAFKPHFIDPILSGAKFITLRRAWANDRTPDLGAPLGLVANPRSPARHRFATAVVQFRASVSFSERSGVLTVEGWRKASVAPNAARVLKVLKGAMSMASGPSCDELAELDGFANWSEMVAFHQLHRANGATPVIERELIGFGAVSPAFSPAEGDPVARKEWVQRS